MLPALVVAATVVSAAAAGPAATKQRVVIDMKIIPKSTFALIPQQPGALERDTGTISGTWQSIPGRDVMRDGQEVTIYNGGVWTLTGKRGRWRFESGTSGSASEATTALPSGPGRWCAGPASTPGSPERGGVATPASGARGTRASKASSPHRSPVGIGEAPLSRGFSVAGL